MFNLVAKNSIPIVLNHIRGTPRDMTTKNTYNNLIQEVTNELEERIKLALKSGIYRWNIFVDPGIGFAKRRDQNMQIIQNLDKFSDSLTYPLLVSFSNKKFVSKKFYHLG
jgi:Dihydropteroate synthase and related enzymes